MATRRTHAFDPWTLRGKPVFHATGREFGLPLALMRAVGVFELAFAAGLITAGALSTPRRVIGAAQSWKVAKELQKLGIEAMATDAWLARTKEPFLDANTVFARDTAAEIDAFLQNIVAGGDGAAHLVGFAFVV